MAEPFCPTCERAVGGDVQRCPECGTSLVRLALGGADPLVGQELDGRYTLKERLGAGGMGAVYRAWQHSMGRDVALKVISARSGQELMLVRRFLREAKIVSGLTHPNIVSVFDFGQAPDGTLYLAMELLEGQTLQQVLNASGPLPPRRALGVALQLCDALEAAHQKGCIHRDLKPANVMLLAAPPGRDVVKVLDFGLSRPVSETGDPITGSGLMVGTYGYIAPEEIRGDADVGPRADLYALGSMLSQMLTGQPTFGRGPPTAILSRQLAGERHGDIAAPALADLVGRLLALDPSRRPASAATTRELIAAQLDGLEGAPLVASSAVASLEPLSSGTDVRPSSVAPRRPLRALGVGGFVALGLAAAGVTVAVLIARERSGAPKPLVVQLAPSALEARDAGPAEAPAPGDAAASAPPERPRLRPRPDDGLIRRLEE